MRVLQTADAFRQLLDKDMEGLYQMKAAHDDVKRRFLEGTARFTAEVAQTDQAIERRRDRLKALVDSHANVLKRKLRTMADANLVQLEAFLGELQEHMTSFDEFVTYTTELNEHGSPFDVIQQFKEMHTRGARLLATKLPVRGDVMETLAFPIDVEYRETDLKKFMDEGRTGDESSCSIIGHLDVVLRQQSDVDTAVQHVSE